jgi:hypothetical protein
LTTSAPSTLVRTAFTLGVAAGITIAEAIPSEVA